MRIIPLTIAGAAVIRLDPVADERGFFARAFCADAFAEAGLPTRFVQANLSRNDRRGTLRGLHWQGAPSAEAKLVRCVRGAAFDVLLDLRAGSASHGRWVAVELCAATGDAVLVPAGVAHGFQTLRAGTDLFYLMTESHQPALGRGVRWDDPAYGIAWPIAAPIVSRKDRGWALAGA